MNDVERGFGRLPQPDARNYQLAERAPGLLTLPRKTKHWAMFCPPLDQGATGTCVGHAGKHFLLSAPVIAGKVNSEPTAFTLYHEACARDVWPGNDGGDVQYGTSVLALMKALSDRGMIGAYAWAEGVDTAAAWLSNSGPMVIGVNFYASMGSLTSEGEMRIEPGSALRGGHAMTLIGWNEQRGMVRGINSWGPRWGQRGRFWMSGETLGRLLSEGGEAATALERRTTPPS